MRLIVNGHPHDVAAPDHETLLFTLRERLGLTGTKLVCGRGECGACTVLLDGESAYSCLTLTAACEQRAITTIEGIAADGVLHPMQAAFIEHDALQCGFCTPGQILAAIALLSENPNPTEGDVRQGMAGNICRCGAYPKILGAVLAVAAQPDGARANG
jgi:aerobic-type carbon monoxide dehydrogenase small subunit (CoxS/CutS family)